MDKIIEIRVVDIAPNPRQPRGEESLLAGMDTIGQINPITVLPMSAIPDEYKNGCKFMIVDGHRRHKTAIDKGIALLKARVLSGIDFEEAMLQAAVSNSEQQAYGPIENARAFLDSIASNFRKTLISAYGFGRADWSREHGRKLAERCLTNIRNHLRRNDTLHVKPDVLAAIERWCRRAGFSIDYAVTKLIPNANIPPDIACLVRKSYSDKEGSLSLGTAIELSRITDSELQKKSVKTVVDLKYTSAETRKLQQLLNTKSADEETIEQKGKLASGIWHPDDIEKRNSKLERYDPTTKRWLDAAKTARRLEGYLAHEDLEDASQHAQILMRHTLQNISKAIDEFGGAEERNDENVISIGAIQ